MAEGAIPLEVWFRAAFLLSYSLKDLGSEVLCKQLGCNHSEILRQALDRLRSRLKETNPLLLGSTRATRNVELAVAPVSYPVGSTSSRALVAAAVEVLPADLHSSVSRWNIACAGRLRLATLPAESANTLKRFVESVVCSDAVVHAGAEEGCENFKAAKGEYFGTARLVLNSLERWCIDETDTGELSSFEDRLGEFVFRFNRGFNVSEIFQSLLDIGDKETVPTYREISVNDWERPAAGCGI